MNIKKSVSFMNEDGSDSDDNATIDIGEYIISEEDKECEIYTSVMNIFLMYYKNLYKKDNGYTLFDDIDFDSKTSTNGALELFYCEIHNYKTCEEKHKILYKLEEYKNAFPEQNNMTLYEITINNNIRITHSLIAGILYISEFDWMAGKWAINKISR